MTERELQLDLSGEVIVLTGAGGVLCGTLARELADRGASVAVLDIVEEKAKEVTDDIEESGGTALPVQCNVLDREQVQEAARTITDELGTPDVLINGAGGNKPDATTDAETEFFDIPDDAAQWVFNLNFIGTLIPSQVFGRMMAEAGEGHILNVSSMTAFRPLTKVLAYGAAKAAVSNFTQWLAVHMAQNYSTDIRVNAIAPGFFLTEQNRFLLIDEDSGDLTPRGQTIIDHTPQGRFGDPEDLVGTVLWLLSSSSSFVDGTIIPIDGGFNAYSGV